MDFNYVYDVYRLTSTVNELGIVPTKYDVLVGFAMMQQIKPLSAEESDAAREFISQTADDLGKVFKYGPEAFKKKFDSLVKEMNDKKNK